MTVLRRDSGQALWAQIEAILKEDISAGAFAAGEPLPTESALAKRFGVNRHTIRQALGRLRDDDLIRVEQGRGSFVQDHVFEYAVSRRTRFSESLSMPELARTRTLLSGEREPAGKRIAGQLGLAAGALVWRIELLVTAGNSPISLVRHYFSADRFPDFLAVFEVAGSITEALRRQGVDEYTRQSTRITSRLPTAFVARHLAQPRHRPVIRTESVNIDGDGCPVEYGVAEFAGDRVQLVVQPDAALA